MVKKGIMPTVSNYNLLIHELFMEARESEADCMVREMEEKGMVPDAITYNILINGSAQVLSSLAYCDLDSEINHLWYTHFVAR
ncbi:pentatricopeptide repeat-containing protein At2g15630, mitochondrial-like [Rosa chinensis]|uniref:pentatricopeptide repeat-containing protein At2g15630, mitochondrial-like n=1 Tax=Rosa chinensis TaxID=74649 RepID=UPI001AD8F959|nr:pentatricopeptide repeat-containing protein At2g15630, mitochondrial-like [Rosa chinensis]